jgi:hypothetical protein
MNEENAMYLFFDDYYWRDGRPVGLFPHEECRQEGKAYKIIADPYYKRITVEQFEDGIFRTTVYDSALFDFRSLKDTFPANWERVQQSDHVLVRDIHERVLWRENFVFEEHLCRKCRVYSPHGLLLSTHHLFYTALHDTFDGVILYDATDRPVLFKHYTSVDGIFTELIEERWDLPHNFTADDVTDSRSTEQNCQPSQAHHSKTTRA